MYSSSCSFFIVISPLWSIDQTVYEEGGEGHCIEIPQIDFAQALIHNQSTSDIEPSCPLPIFATSIILAKCLMVFKSFQGNKQYVWRSLSTLKWHRDLDLGLQANIPMDCQAPGRHTKALSVEFWLDRELSCQTPGWKPKTMNNDISKSWNTTNRVSAVSERDIGHRQKLLFKS